MKLTDQQRAELKALADRFTSGYNVTVEAKRAEMFCAAIPALLADLEVAELATSTLYDNARIEITRLQDELAAMRQPPKHMECRWKYMDDPDRCYWEGSCGITWIFSEEGPEENGVRFCPKCGKPVTFTRGAVLSESAASQQETNLEWLCRELQDLKRAIERPEATIDGEES